MSSMDNKLNELLNARLSLGRERYGHGVIVSNDTKQFGTETNDWLEMAQEELLDGIIYMAAHIIRGRHSLADSMNIPRGASREEGVIDDNQEIMNLVNTRMELYTEREFKGQDNIIDDIINLTKKLLLARESPGEIN